MQFKQVKAVTLGIRLIQPVHFKVLSSFISQHAMYQLDYYDLLYFIGKTKSQLNSRHNEYMLQGNQEGTRITIINSAQL